MRPPEFTGGNPQSGNGVDRLLHRFNEAAGIHRRKPNNLFIFSAQIHFASMRPPEFTGGNKSSIASNSSNTLLQ